MVADRVLTLALVVLSGVAILGRDLRAADHALYLSASDAPDKEAQIELGAFFLRWFMPQIVFYGVGAVATGLLQAERKFAAPMFAPILNNLSRDRHVRHLRAAGRGRNDLRREHHVRREDRPRGRDHARRRRDDAGALAVAAKPRVPLAPPLRLEPPRGATAGQARAVGRRLRRGEPARLHRDHRVHRQVRRRLPDLRERVHPVPAPARDRRRVDLHRAPAADVRPMGRPATSTGCARCSRAGCATRSSSSCRRRSATWRSPCPSSACCCSTAAPTRTTPRTSRARCRRSRSGLPFFSAFQLLTRTFYAMQDTRTPALVNVARGGREHRGEPPVPVVRLGRPRARAWATRRRTRSRRSCAWWCCGSGWAGSTEPGSPRTLVRVIPAALAGRGRGVPGVARGQPRARTAAPARSAAWWRSPSGLWWACLCSRYRRLS